MALIIEFLVEVSKCCFMGQGMRWACIQTTQFIRWKWWNVTNNNVVPVNQASREQFLGNTISRVLWRNNRTNIEPATFHLAGNCIRYWIRFCQERKHRHQRWRAIFTHFVPEDVIVKGNGTFKAMEVDLSPRPGVNSNRMSFSSFLEFLKEKQRIFFQLCLLMVFFYCFLSQLEQASIFNIKRDSKVAVKHGWGGCPKPLYFHHLRHQRVCHPQVNWCWTPKQYLFEIENYKLKQGLKFRLKRVVFF